MVPNSSPMFIATGASYLLFAWFRWRVQFEP